MESWDDRSTPLDAGGIDPGDQADRQHDPADRRTSCAIKYTCAEEHRSGRLHATSRSARQHGAVHAGQQPDRRGFNADDQDGVCTLANPGSPTKSEHSPTAGCGLRIAFKQRADTRDAKLQTEGAGIGDKSIGCSGTRCCHGEAPSPPTDVGAHSGRKKIPDRVRKAAVLQVLTILQELSTPRPWFSHRCLYQLTMSARMSVAFGHLPVALFTVKDYNLGQRPG